MFGRNYSILSEISIQSVPVLLDKDGPAEVREKIKATKSKVYPVADDQEFLGLVNEEEAEAYSDGQQQELPFNQPQRDAFIYEHVHPYQAARLMLELDRDVLPVLNEQRSFLGLLTREHLFRYFSYQTGIAQDGGVLILRIKTINYSLSEIARICEGNDVILLNVQLNLQPESEYMEVVLKTNTKNLESLKSTFERYDYEILFSFGTANESSNLEERYRSLMNYINM